MDCTTQCFNKESILDYNQTYIPALGRYSSWNVQPLHQVQLKITSKVYLPVMEAINGKVAATTHMVDKTMSKSLLLRNGQQTDGILRGLDQVNLISTPAERNARLAV